MAGASLAAELAPFASVLVLEAEDRPGYHSTGRSAAFWDECYGGPDIVPLTLASGGFLEQNNLLTKRGALHIGRAEDKAKVDQFLAEFGETGATIERLDRAQIEQKLPDLLPEWIDGVWEPACSDIDVAGLHSLYLGIARKAGAELCVRAIVESADHGGDGWRIKTANEREFRAVRLINAAGAWADELARIAGVLPLEITPFRRTVVQLRTNPEPRPNQPLVLDISGDFYFKPSSGRLWLSPHDEEPSPPCDAAPEELAVATVVDRLESVVDWTVESVETKWAGLRSFAPDRLPVYGFDRAVDDFFWFAGQGGYGIQTAPAAARLARQLLLGQERDAMTKHLDAARYDPSRFAGR